jgi:phenylalanyl-tRNA synthetase alpha chain
MFHQLEGMVVNKTANFSELKGLLIYFLQTFFENPNLEIRFRASYFPFTEPSAEVDILCMLCAGQKCPFCSHSGWLEVLGCGMIHPNVLHYANVDPDDYQGYAFGIGIERLTLLRYRIPDIRLLFENDSRLLSQFK